MKISAAIITRDSEKTIIDCLNSIYQFVDEIIIVIDARTKDNTYRTILMNFGKLSNVKIYFYDWSTDSFAEARNFAASKCTGDWIFLIDSDEILTEMFDIDQVPDDIDFIAAKIINPEKGNEIINHSYKIYRNFKSITWKYSRHETLTPIKDGSTAFVDNFILKHKEKSYEDIKEKSKSLLEHHFKQIKNEPENPYVKGQIANCYQALGAWQNAIDWYQIAFLQNVETENKALVCIQLYVCYEVLQKLDIARFWIELSIQICPEQIMGRMMLYKFAEHFEEPEIMSLQREHILKTGSNSKLPYDLNFSQIKF